MRGVVMLLDKSEPIETRDMWRGSFDPRKPRRTHDEFACQFHFALTRRGRSPILPSGYDTVLWAETTIFGGGLRPAGALDA